MHNDFTFWSIWCCEKELFPGICIMYFYLIWARFALKMLKVNYYCTKNKFSLNFRLMKDAIPIYSNMIKQWFGIVSVHTNANHSINDLNAKILIFNLILQ